MIPRERPVESCLGDWIFSQGLRRLWLEVDNARQHEARLLAQFFPRSIKFVVRTDESVRGGVCRFLQFHRSRVERRIISPIVGNT